MNWYDEVKLNLKKKRAILFSKSSECLLPLQSQLEDTDKRTAVLWSLYFAEDAVELVSARYPDESAPCDALALTKLWAQGKVKMPEAKRAILECHAMAKRISSPPRYCALSRNRSSVRLRARKGARNRFFCIRIDRYRKKIRHRSL